MDRSLIRSTEVLCDAIETSLEDARDDLHHFVHRCSLRFDDDNAVATGECAMTHIVFVMNFDLFDNRTPGVDGAKFTN